MPQQCCFKLHCHSTTQQQQKHVIFGSDCYFNIVKIIKFPFRFSRNLIRYPLPEIGIRKLYRHWISYLIGFCSNHSMTILIQLQQNSKPINAKFWVRWLCNHKETFQGHFFLFSKSLTELTAIMSTTQQLTLPLEFAGALQQHKSWMSFQTNTKTASDQNQNIFLTIPRQTTIHDDWGITNLAQNHGWIL